MVAPLPPVTSGRTRTGDTARSVLGREHSELGKVDFQIMVAIKGQPSQRQRWQGDVPSLPPTCHSSGVTRC